MNPTRRLLALALVVGLAQVGFLGWMIAGRAAILRDGREVLLKVQPVDPRDLLRGDYVRLGYDISAIPVQIISNLPTDRNTSLEEPIHVRLGKDQDGFWRARSARLGSAFTDVSETEVDITGTVAPGWSLVGDTVLSVDYGIERFYLPEGEGKQIEADMRVREFGILAAVGSNGVAQIKALMDGGTRLFEEPYY